ncbi:hypothetical protein ASG01_02025 [Chryseobacterium sp. Leaf180]|uniref:hypothetical protein n=1 Tax=Chryseobacterium sp. Leaf180 TaxID=1736289 RepID=UPI0006F2F9D9|nr:hypothetical protein [Chryseobacterium sp. Leaf180]KQR94676.1 hypothetical protein ASG01_02025 [Chryseobacterium sp. Leaf180]
MKKLLLAGIFCLAVNTVYAQDDTNDYALRTEEKFGYIVDKSGKKTEGIVRLVGSDRDPWQNQKKVKFVASTDIDKSKKKQKFKTYDSDDLTEYVAYDESNRARRFQVVKYTNAKEGFNTATGGLSGNIKAFNNLTKSNQFAEVVTDGKIKVYKLYGYPTTFAAGQSQIDEADAETDRMRKNPSYIYTKKGSKLKELNINETKIITADCPVVKTKITKGSYVTLKTDTKQRSGLGSFIKKQVDNVMSDMPGIVDEVIVDYNESCK